MSAAVHIVCPCCGREMSTAPSVAEMAVAAKLSPSEAIILDVLASRRGRYASVNEIADALYGDDPSGGPDNFNGIIRVLVHNLRRKLADVKFLVWRDLVAIVADRSANGPKSIGGGQGYRMERVRPSSGAARHLLPQGEKAE